MNNRLNQIQELLNNPLFGESEKYDLLKDIILEQNFAEIQNVDLSEKVEDLFEQYLENYNKQDPFNETVIKTGFENLDNNLPFLCVCISRGYYCTCNPVAFLLRIWNGPYFW